jgi:sugar phosphate isomerase/epimerase
MDIPFSVHLPIVIPHDFEDDYLDVFFLDEDASRREMSFRMLELNLKEASKLQPDYCVLHFAGIYRSYATPFMDFEQVLNDALYRINSLAERYQVKVLLEYMGSNCKFYAYDAWIKKIAPYAMLGILTDTGHLYFSSVIHGFDYMQALDALAVGSDAFHLWTTKGGGAYGDSQYYRDYHHIIPHEGQMRSDNWAFDSERVFKRIAQERKPMIIEASTVYEGMPYFYEGIAWMVSLIK